MDYMRIARIMETDFDRMVSAAGGNRFSADDSREKGANCDYVLGGAVLELKIVEEEGLAKVNRQRKVAELFAGIQNGKPTVVLDPALLDAAGQQSYYSILATPVKTHVKKAAKQLSKSAPLVGPWAPRVLILVNGGFGALSHEEFKELALKRCMNDTSQIDVLIICGCYHYSDTFDSCIIFPLEEVVLNLDRPFLLFAEFQDAWHRFLQEFMAAAAMGYEDRFADRMPVVDLEYQLSGIRYVKPAPRMGEASAFFPNGRPRANSTGIEKCPPVARTFPGLSLGNWEKMRQELQDPWFLKESYHEWLSLQVAEDGAVSTPLKPFVPVTIEYDGFMAWLAEEAWQASFRALCEYASELFQARICALLDRAIAYEDNRLCLPDAILLDVTEIGQDKANDYGSILRLTGIRDDEHVEELVSDQKFFYEYGLAVAGAYAIKLGVPMVLYHRNRRYVWE